RMTLAHDGAIADRDVPEVPGRFCPELDRVVPRGEVTADHAHVLRRAASAQRQARLEAERVVTRLDVAVRDAHIPAAIRIDAIRVAVQHRHALDIDVLAAEEAHVVVAGVGDRQAADLDALAFPEPDRLRALALPAIAVDRAGADDADLLHP